MRPSRPARPGLAALPNLGPKSAAMLAQAGIHTPEQLQALGAVAAFDRVRRSGQSPSLNLLWALEGALTHTRWQDVARRERGRLLITLDSLTDSAWP